MICAEQNMFFYNNFDAKQQIDAYSILMHYHTFVAKHFVN